MTLHINTVAPIKELSNEQLITRAPSVGATEPIGTVSDRYSFVPTTKAVDYLREAGWLPFQVKESRTVKPERNGFQRHQINFARPDLDLGDKRLMLTLLNSHDTGSAFQLLGAVHRLVCSNGMTIPESAGMSFRHRHVGFTPELFIQNAGEIANDLNKIGDVVENWQTIDLTPSEYEIYAESAHALMYDPENHAPIQPRQLLTARRHEDRNPNLWNIHNRVQENIIKGGLRGYNAKGRPTRTRAVNSIDRDQKLNQALWTLSEKMAELKAA